MGGDLKSFNPRAREGRDRYRLRERRDRYHCFNPRAREGRDYALITKESRREVSIHAPARGATGLLLRLARSV